MTREEKKAVTALRKSLPALVRPLIKPYHYKSIDGAVWTAQNDMLFILVPSISTPRGEEQVYVKVTCGAKPLFADGLLWDVLGFGENKSKPMSLRVNGAFALYEVPAYERRRPLESLEGELAAAHIQDELAEFSAFLASVRGREMDWFRALEAGQERYANMEVMRLMLMLHDGRRDEALAYVTAHDVSAYIVNRKTVGQLVAEYCL